MLVFGAIGVSNTLLHSATVIVLVERSLATSVTANIVGFCVANIFSFFANSFFTFKRRPTLVLYWKFLLVSALSLILAVGFSALAEALDWHYLVGLTLVILFGPILTFLLHKTYAFRHSPSKP